MPRRIVRAIAAYFSNELLIRFEARLDSLAMMHGKNLVIGHAPLTTLGSLDEAGFRVFSQWDEDGIIQWLIRKIPGIPSSFVEFGVENYKEANTRFLLCNNNWRGLVLDASQRHINDIRNQTISWRHDLSAVCGFVTRDNINDLLGQAGLSGEIGILSIDVDGNDYWIWSAIEVVNPVIVICEYNAVFGDRLPLTIPYQAHFSRSQAHCSNLYYGASITALEQLANKRGYVLLGSNLAGNNAFFVRRDYADHILPHLAKTNPRPSMFRESRNAFGHLTYVAGTERAKHIETLPLLRTDTMQTVCLRELMPTIYSEGWLSRMQGSRPNGPGLTELNPEDGL